MIIIMRLYRCTLTAKISSPGEHYDAAIEIIIIRKSIIRITITALLPSIMHHNAFMSTVDIDLRTRNDAGFNDDIQL
jgi:hypothetical protein